jgi:site-specific recombinase XerD
VSDDDLEPIAPAEALDLWLDRLESTRSDATIESYRYRMQSFLQFCEASGIDNMNDLTSRDIVRYDSARRADGLAVATLNTQMGTLKRFIRFCARLEAVADDLPAQVEVPSVDLAERVDDELLSSHRAEAIRESLIRYQRASRRHAMFELLWHTGCRLGGLRSLDLDDCYFEREDLERLRHQDYIEPEALENVDLPFIYFRHRPDRGGTPLKNKKDGERPVALDEDVAEFVQEYIDVNRVERADSTDRRPLFTTEKGENARVSKASIRREVYIITQPCRFGECPHDRDTETCEALSHGLESRCPSSRSPHPIRSGAITAMRDDGWPPEVVAERVNATPEVIRAHYDHPDPIRRMQSRRKFLDGGDSD